MSTLNPSATETINRIISVFPPYQQKQVRLQLATILKAVISQRLVPRADGKGRVPALEVLVSTAFTRELIADKDRTKELPDAIAKGHTTYGMQTFDQSLMGHVKNGLVTYEEALKHVSNPDDFALRFRGIASTSDSTNEFASDGEEKVDEKPDDGTDSLLDDDFNIDRFERIPGIGRTPAVRAPAWFPKLVDERKTRSERETARDASAESALPANGDTVCTAGQERRRRGDHMPEKGLTAHDRTSTKEPDRPAGRRLRASNGRSLPRSLGHRQTPGPAPRDPPRGSGRRRRSYGLKPRRPRVTGFRCPPTLLRAPKGTSLATLRTDPERGVLRCRIRTPLPPALSRRPPRGESVIC